jgi:hypothetical protein
MSVEEWLRVRAFLQENRHALSSSAAVLYPASRRVEGTSLLAAPSWIPGAPLDLDAVSLGCVPAPDGPVEGWASALGSVLPVREDGPQYRSYSAAMADLAAPRIFENRSTYRLGDADLAGPKGSLAFGRGTYFDGIDIGEACAHEYAAVRMGILPGTALRAAVGEPWDPGRRPVNVAISTLTLRVDHASGAATFPLHRRDPGSVGHAGGLYQVLPVGMFQASDDEPQNQASDFSLWRCMLREFAEELLGRPEEYGPRGTSVDYGRWPFARRMGEARAAGSVRAWVLGMGVDPLTLATDLLAVVAFDAEVFDELLGGIVRDNAEGNVLLGEGHGLEFSEETIGQFTGREPMQAAGAALLRLAWRHRQLLVG